MVANESDNKRIVLIAILFAVLILGLMSATLFKVTTLKVSPPIELIAVSTTLNSTSRQLAKRGQLLDRRGRILPASTSPAQRSGATLGMLTYWIRMK